MNDKDTGMQRETPCSMIVTDVFGIDVPLEVEEFSIEGADIYYSIGCPQNETHIPEQRPRPVLNMHFCLEGSQSSYDHCSEEWIRLRDRQHVLNYTPGFDGHYVLEGGTVRSFGVRLYAPFFERLLSYDSEHLELFWDKVDRGEPASIAPHPMPITRRQRSVISDLQYCSYTGDMKRLFFESRIIELFLLQVTQAGQAVRPYAARISAEDVEKLHAARAFVAQHIFDPITLTQVARHAGLNDFKLKKGFRELFGNTVFGYLNELKMSYARQMLLDTSCTVYEIAYALGYTEPYSFSKAFRKYYGYLPREVRH